MYKKSTLIDTIVYRMINRMKVTALIPDSLVNDVKKLSKGKNITDSIVIALREWIALQKLKAISQKIEKFPLKFSPGFSAESIRTLNRKR